MSRSEAVRVVRLGKIGKHPNADSLSITQVDGCPVIVRSGEYDPDTLAVYIPVDFVISEETYIGKQLSFLKFKSGSHRVKAMKLRGVFSMGLLVPFSMVIEPHSEACKANPALVASPPAEGDDVGELLGITKHEEPESISLGGQQDRDPGLMPVYGIEPYRKYKSIFEVGEEVVVTEKIHGCVAACSTILMADGSYRRAKDIQVGDYVMGMTNGAAVSSKVLRVLENGTASRWTEVKTTCNDAGPGPSHRVFRTTPNHPVLTERGEIPSEDLKMGDVVFVPRAQQALSFFQRDVLIGKLLGDGSRAGNGRSVTWGHCVAQADYEKWTKTALGPLAHPATRQTTSGYGTEMYSGRTVASSLVEALVRDFHPGGQAKKIVPKNLQLSPVSLAFWYMDDGSLAHHEGQEDRAHFAVCSFTAEDCDVLKSALATLSIKGVVYEHDGYNRLRLNADDAEKLFLYIAPYIPPCMQYKLPERYRGGAGWLPPQAWFYKASITKQTVTSVGYRNNEPSLRYDFETESGNYMPGGVAVKNCNARYIHDGERLWVGSHRTWRTVDDTSVWSTIAKKYDLETKLAAHPGVGLYGEVFGDVQDLKYGFSKGEVGFRVFDIYTHGEKVGARLYGAGFFDFYELTAWCKRMDFPMVPILYVGPYSPEVVEPLADGDTTLDAKNIREGIVIKSVFEKWDQNVGRKQLKLVSQGYLLRANGTERH